MKGYRLREWIGTGLAALAIICCIPAGMNAQPGGEVERGGEVAFGPPLRDNILFHYVYTERVRHRFLNDAGEVIDSSERNLIYYITQRQMPSEFGAGAHNIETNIDSMKVRYVGSDGEISFNTQVLSDVQNITLVRHPAVLVPSTLVNSVTHATVSPYGTLGDTLRSESIASYREQKEDPMLDDFTYKRMDHLLTDEYLTTIFFPWRGVLPIGQTIEYGRPLSIPFIGALDRITFEDTASVLITPAEEGRGHLLRFTARLSDPTYEWITYDAIPLPILLNGASGTMTGQLELDQDGVVLSGFSVTNGTATGTARGKAYNVKIDHEVYIELGGMVNFAIGRERGN